MPGSIPNIIRLFRIVHINNIEHILKYGMVTKISQTADKEYINIGDSDLISKRNDYTAKINPPGGLLGEYIPFYFGPLSPMLLKIRNGTGGVIKRPQSEIIYLICHLKDIIDNCKDWCFTNGHAKTAITEFFNDLEDLNQVDWDVVYRRYWNNTEEDFDCMRRKQAEFLVKNFVPNNCIKAIITYNEESKIYISNIVDALKLNIPVIVNPKNQFYY